MVQLMPLHPQTPSSLATFKSRQVSPFWYWLTQVVLEKRPLNGCSSSVSGCIVLQMTVFSGTNNDVSRGTAYSHGGSLPVTVDCTTI